MFNCAKFLVFGLILIFLGAAKAKAQTALDSPNKVIVIPAPGQPNYNDTSSIKIDSLHLNDSIQGSPIRQSPVINQDIDNPKDEKRISDSIKKAKDIDNNQKKSKPNNPKKSKPQIKADPKKTSPQKKKEKLSPVVKKPNPVIDSSLLKQDTLARPMQLDSAKKVNKLKPTTKKKGVAKPSAKKPITAPIKAKITKPDTTAIKIDTSQLKLAQDTVPKIPDSLLSSFGPLLCSLTNATGHILADDGKWYSSPNRIPYMNPEFNNKYYELFKIGTENFTHIDARRMTLNGHKCYLITLERIKSKYGGDEGTPTKFYRVTDYYCIDSGKWQLLHPKGVIGLPKQPYAVNIPIMFSGSIAYYSTEPMMFEFIHKDMNFNVRKMHLYDTSVHTYLQLIMLPKKGKDGGSIRFNTALSYAKHGTDIPNDNLIIFDLQYFSLPYASFKIWDDCWSQVPTMKAPTKPKPKPKKK